MGIGASATRGPLAGPSGSGLKGVRGLRQKEPIESIFQNAPGLDVADAKIVGKIAAHDLADDETTIGCGESLPGDFENMSIIGADEIPAPVAQQPSGKDALMQKLKLGALAAFMESAKSGALAAALQQTSPSSGSSSRKSGSETSNDSPASQTVLMRKLSLSFVQSAKSGTLSSAFEQLNKEREEKKLKEADAKLKLCKALVGSVKDGGLGAAFSKVAAERK